MPPVVRSRGVQPGPPPYRIAPAASRTRHASARTTASESLDPRYFRQRCPQPEWTRPLAVDTHLEQVIALLSRVLVPEPRFRKGKAIRHEIVGENMNHRGKVPSHSRFDGDDVVRRPRLTHLVSTDGDSARIPQLARRIATSPRQALEHSPLLGGRWINVDREMFPLGSCANNGFDVFLWQLPRPALVVAVGREELADVLRGRVRPFLLRHVPASRSEQRDRRLVGIQRRNVAVFDDRHVRRDLREALERPVRQPDRTTLRDVHVYTFNDSEWTRLPSLSHVLAAPWSCHASRK